MSILEWLKGSRGLQQLKDHEGLRLKPYKCTAKKTTIGYGRNLQDRGITKDEAEFLLMGDIESDREKIIKKWPWFKKLNDARKWVIINMVFNLGINNRKTLKKTTDELEKKFDGEPVTFEDVANIMLSGKWAQQVKGRARDLAEQMATGKFKKEK